MYSFSKRPYLSEFRTQKKLSFLVLKLQAENNFFFWNYLWITDNPRTEGNPQSHSNPLNMNHVKVENLKWITQDIRARSHPESGRIPTLFQFPFMNQSNQVNRLNTKAHTIIHNITRYQITEPKQAVNFIFHYINLSYTSSTSHIIIIKEHRAPFRCLAQRRIPTVPVWQSVKPVPDSEKENPTISESKQFGEMTKTRDQPLYLSQSINRTQRIWFSDQKED